MLCTNIKKRTRTCGSTTGGLSDIGFFDPFDLRFISGAAVNGAKTGYSSFVARAGATGDLVFPVTFVDDQAELTWKQSVNGCSAKYTNELIFQLAENDQTMVNLLEAYDAAGCCCGLGMFVRYRNGRIVVLGERYVDNDVIPKFTMKQSGSDGTSGKLFDDFNGGNIHILGDYSRLPYEYTGTWASVLAFTSEETDTVYDTSLDFATSTTDSGAGVSALAGGGTDADLLFEFNAISNPTGTASSMLLHVGHESDATQILTVSFPADYVGQAFRVTTPDGTVYSSTFVNGPRVVGLVSTPVTPAAPTSFVLNDAANTAGFTPVTGYASASKYYERTFNYSAGSGATWTALTANPINVGNIDIASGDLAVRVKAGTGRNAGTPLVSGAAFTDALFEDTFGQAAGAYTGPSASTGVGTASVTTGVANTDGSGNLIVGANSSTVGVVTMTGVSGTSGQNRKITIVLQEAPTASTLIPFRYQSATSQFYLAVLNNGDGTTKVSFHNVTSGSSDVETGSTATITGLSYPATIVINDPDSNSATATVNGANNIAATAVGATKALQLVGYATKFSSAKVEIV